MPVFKTQELANGHIKPSEQGRFIPPEIMLSDESTNQSTGPHPAPSLKGNLPSVYDAPLADYIVGVYV